MDADAEAVGYINEFGQELLELGRPRALYFVGALRNEIVGVLKARDGDGLFTIDERKSERTGDGFACGLLAGKSELYHGR